MQIERRSGLSVEEFRREYQVPHLPVILTDAADGWGALNWTPRFFRERFEDKVIQVDTATPMKMGEFIDQVMVATVEQPAPYLRNLDIPTVFPELLRDVHPVFPHALPDRVRNPLFPRHFPQDGHFMDLFIGGPGSGFPFLHYDVHHLFSWLVQIYGRKRFFLYPPEQSPYMYPNPEAPDESLIDDPVHPDYDRWPLFEKAQPIEVTLEAGEALFFPCHWWHVTWMEEPNITVGFDQLTTANWRDFMGDQFARRREQPLKAGAVLGYLMAAGLGLSVYERATGKHSDPVDLDFVGQLRDAVRFQL